MGQASKCWVLRQTKRLRNEFTGVLTGKGINWGGSLIRPEATGYGTVYFAAEMLKTKGDSFKGKTVAISGSGNVAQFACQKATELGAKVVTLSDSKGYIYDSNGIDAEKLAWIMDLKNNRRGRIKEYADQFDGVTFNEGAKPWDVAVDVALPCATQNELDENHAKSLIDSGCVCVTKESVKPISEIHNRQPLLLEEEQIEKWLVGDHILKDNISSNIQIHKASAYVNSPRNNDYKCIQPIQKYYLKTLKRRIIIQML